MTYEFSAAIRREGSRAFLPVAFNVWEETGRRGNIPCRVGIEGHSFECRLLPKGGGTYWIPVGKGLLSALPEGEALRVTLEPLQSLSRINHDSPYSREHPIREICGVRDIPVQAGLCGHGCVAMLAGVGLPEAVSLMGKGHASWSKILEALDYYGIRYAEKAVYPRRGAHRLPACCIVRNDDAFLLWYGGSFRGVPDADVDPGKTVSYLEIPLPQTGAAGQA